MYVDAFEITKKVHVEGTIGFQFYNCNSVAVTPGLSSTMQYLTGLAW